MKSVCECGHLESDHADFGFRRCAKRNCPCDQYIEDDDAIEWKEGQGRPGLGDALITVALLGLSLIALAKCLSMGPEPEPRRPKPDPIAVDSARAKGCVEGCTCDMLGVIKECPDIKPPLHGVPK